LHSQFVEVGVEEGDDSLREWRRPIEVHGGVMREDFKWRVGGKLLNVGLKSGTRIETCMSYGQAQRCKCKRMEAAVAGSAIR
jgi:hypothetical protein